MNNFEKSLDEIVSNIWKDTSSRSSSLYDNLLNESLNLDRQLAEICPLLPEVKNLNEDDNDLYILWLKEECQSSIQENINGIDVMIFYSTEKLLDFINDISTSNVLLIINKMLVASILSYIDISPQILFVYVLVNEENKHHVLITDSCSSCFKIFDNKNDLFHAITKDMSICTNDSISTTIFDLEITEESTNQTKHVSSVWYRLLIECLLSLNVWKTTAKTDLIKYCREQYSIDDNEQQKLITEFENEYSSASAIQCIKTRNIDEIFQFRCFIVDLQNQLEQNIDELLVESFPRLYRGQRISPLELEKLKKSQTKYITVNTYLSTTMDKDIALTYISDNESDVLFEIDVNITACIKNKRTCPVYVQPFSYFPDELEVIFPFGSIFRVNSIEKKDNRYYIYLTLTNEDQKDELRHYIEQNYIGHLPPIVKFVGLLVHTHDLEKAERMILMLIQDLQFSADSFNMTYIYDMMGQIWYIRGDYDCALSWFEKALNAVQTLDIFRSVIHNHIGLVCYQRGQLSTALKYYNRALHDKDKMELLQLATLYENIGNIHLNIKKYNQALEFFYKALDLRRSQSSSPTSYASIYSSIADILSVQKEHTKALQSEKYALNIIVETVSKNHPTLVTAYTRVGIKYSLCGDHKLAIIYGEKALTIISVISKKSSSDTNFDPLICMYLCAYIGYQYAHIRNVSKVVLYTSKATDVFDRFRGIIEKSHHSLRNIYDTLAGAYTLIADFASALKYLTMRPIFRGEPMEQFTTLSSIAGLHQLTRSSKLAFNSFQKSLEFYTRLTPSMIDLNTGATVMHHIASMYQSENNLDKAVCLAEKELQLRCNIPNPNFEDIVSVYDWLADLCPNKRTMYRQNAIDIVVKKILPITNDRFGWHCKIALYFSEGSNMMQARYHYQLALDYLLQTSSPDIIDLMPTYNMISLLYQQTGMEDIDAALYHAETNHDICYQLLHMRQIPSYIKVRLRLLDGYSSNEVQQSGFLMYLIFLIYSRFQSIYSSRGDHERALEYCLKQEDIMQSYTGEKEMRELGEHYYQMALSFHNTTVPDRAIVYFEKSVQYKLADYNEYGSRYFLLGLNYFKSDNYIMSMSKLKIALTFFHNAKSIDHTALYHTYYFAGRSCLEMKNYKHAIVYYQHVIRNLLPFNWLHNRMLASSNMFSAWCLHFIKPWDIEQTLDYALTGIGVGEHLFIDSELADNYWLIGRLYLHIDDYENALKYFNKAVEHAVKVHTIYTWIRAVYMRIGDFDKAYEYAERTIDGELTETSTEYNCIFNAYISMGNIHFRLGQYKLALEWYQKAFDIQEISQCEKLEKSYYIIYSYIGRIYYEYGQLTDASNHYQTAQMMYSAIDNEKNLPINLYINLGLLECKLGNYYLALDYFGQAFELIYNKEHNFHCEYKLLYNHIGYVYFKLNNIEIAMKNYVKSLSLYSKYNENHPDLAIVYKNIGVIHEQVDHNYSLALAFYKRALACVPKLIIQIIFYTKQ